MQLLLGLTALVQVWSVHTGQQVESHAVRPPHHRVWFESGQVRMGKTPPTHPAVTADARLARQGNRWLIGEPDGVWLSELASGVSRLPLPESPSAVAWVPESQGLVALTTGPSVLHYFPRSDAQTARRLPLPPALDCNRTRLHMRGMTVTFVCNDRIVRADLAAHRIEDSAVPADRIAFDASGRRARIHGRTLFVEHGGRTLRRIQLPKDRTWNDLAMDAQRIVAGTSDGGAYEFSVSTGRRLWHQKLGEDAVSVALVAGQPWFAVDDSDPQRIDHNGRRIMRANLQPATWSHVQTDWVWVHGSRAICRANGDDDCAQRLMLDTFVNAVALGPDQQVAFIGNFDGIGVWNPKASATPVADRALVGARIHDTEVWQAALDGSTIVISSAQEAGVVTAEGVRSGPALGRWPVAVAGQMLWWSTSDQAGPRRLRFWDLQTHTPLRIDPIHRTQVTAVVASPDRRWVATGDSSGLVVLWNVKTRQMQHVFRVGETIEQLVFDAQSARLAVRAFVDGYTDRPQPFWPEPVLTPQPAKTPDVRQWRVNQPVGAVALTPKGLVAGVGEYLIRVTEGGQVETLHAFDAPIEVIQTDGDAVLVAFTAARGIARVDAAGKMARLPMRGRLHRPERLWTDGHRTALLGRQLGASAPALAVWQANRPAVLTLAHPKGAPGEALVLLDMAPHGRRAQLLLTGNGEDTGWLQTWDFDQAKVVDAPRSIGSWDLYSLVRGGDGALWVGGYRAIHRIQGRRQLQTAREEGQFPKLAATAAGVAEAHGETVRWWQHARGKIIEARASVAFAGGDITALSARGNEVAVAQQGTLTYHGPTVWTLSWYAR
jgi:hypothetical protein